MITIGLALIWLAMLLAQHTPVGRRMRRVLVEMPANRLSRIRRRTVVVLGVLAGMLFLSAMLLDHEAMVIAGLSLPEFGTLFASAEMSVWVDALIAVSSAAVLFRARTAFQWVQMRLARPRHRAPRARRARRPVKPANDDELGPLLAAA